MSGPIPDKYKSQAWKGWITGLLLALVGAGILTWEQVGKVINFSTEYARTNAPPAEVQQTNAAPVIELPATGSVVVVEQPPVAQGPRIVSAKKGPGRTICVKTEGCDRWPQSDGAKHTQGKLYIGDVFVDAMTPGQMKGDPKTLDNAFGSGEHSINAREGETLSITVRRLDGKERTPPAPFKWEFPST